MNRPGDAVDATLIEEMLRLSPEERLRQNDRSIAAIEELRRAFQARRANDPTDQAGG